jgi:hypothetical protein
MAAMGTRRDRKPYYDEEPVIAGAMKYHREFCWAIGMIGPRQRRLKSGSEAINLGLQPCSVCKPYPYELWRELQRRAAGPVVPAASLPVPRVVDRVVESAATAEALSSRESISSAFEQVVKILREIAVRLEGLEAEEAGDAAAVCELIRSAFEEITEIVKEIAGRVQGLESEETGEAGSTRESIPSEFAEIVNTLKEIAVGLELPFEPRVSPDELINLLAGRARPSFPAWLASMLHFMRQLRNRVAHPSKDDPVTDNQLEAWRACFEVFQEWAERWGWKR